MKDDQQPTFGRLFVVLIIIWFASFWFSGSKKIEPHPPEPPPVISSEMDKASEAAAQLLKRHLRDVIDKLEHGQLTDERECRDLLAAGVKASREAAWSDIKAADVAAFADGWTPQKQIERLKQIIGESASGGHESPDDRAKESAFQRIGNGNLCSR